MFFKKLVVGPFQCNCHLLVCEHTGEAALVDPGDEPKKILKLLDEAKTALKTDKGLDLKLKYLLHTHAHLDHIGGTRGVKEACSPICKIALHPEDHTLYQALKMQGELFNLKYEDPLPVDYWLEDQDELKVGTLKLSILHVPGHSPGSIALRLHQSTQNQIQESVFTGDTLFQGSVGRTDLWGADQSTLFKSIHQRLLVLDDDTRIYPGHGPSSLIGIEKRENPFLT